MPGPPPPPPPGPPPPPPPPGPPPPSFPPAAKLGSGGGPDDRGALLKSIRQGAKLKKTVTVDKSAPIISGKVSNNNGSPATGNGISSSPMPNGMALGGLFAGGMPKLKPTGLLGNQRELQTGAATAPPNLNNNNDRSPTSKGRPANSVQDQLKRQLHHPSDTRTRGPPPPAPMRHLSVDEDRQSKVLTIKQPNQSSLHRKSKSNANLSVLDAPDAAHPLLKPVISHGKPHLAPKPPLLNGKPTPPNKLSLKTSKAIGRAQSMRTPRSPSPQSPTPALELANKFGTVRNMSSLLGQSLSNLNSRPRPPLASRPSVPPPSVPPPPTPKLTPVKPPSHAPPPPPSHAPPPPPHKTLSQPSRPPPAIPAPASSNPPPPPPPRHSSMRDVQHQQVARRLAADLDEKFKSAFAAPERFPRPPPYRNVVKSYTNKQESVC